MITVTKVCQSCNRDLHGRTDKKFCNDHCRNTHNNHLNSDGNNYIRNINHCLRKNRRILESLLANREITRATLSKLHSKGFSVKYFTHSHTNKKGKLFHFCYEYGYAKLEGDCVMIVRKKGIE